MKDVRIVAEHSPSRFAILGLCREDEAPPEMFVNGTTYYRAKSTPRWILYRAAISGWGAAAPDPSDPRPVFSPGQR